MCVWHTWLGRAAISFSRAAMASASRAISPVRAATFSTADPVSRSIVDAIRSTVSRRTVDALCSNSAASHDLKARLARIARNMAVTR